MKRLQTAFVAGMLILVPVLLTIDILRWVVHTVEESVRGVLPTGLLPFDFRGLGLLTAVALILLTGFLAQNYIGKWLVGLLDSGVRRIAFVGGIYSGIKKFLETIFSPGNQRFSGVVLVEFPRAGVWSIGFRTGQPDAKLSRAKPGLVNLFIPLTPNPTAGFYLLVAEKELIPLDMTVQEAFKLVISIGIVTSEGESP